MKYCVINGSPKANRSRTMRIVRIFMDGIRNVDDDAQFDVFNLVDYNIMSCKGCSVCGHTKECKFTIKKMDDMKDILPRYFGADKIILATPLYFYSISSYMQKFLERTLPFYMKQEHYETLLSKGMVMISTGSRPEYGIWEAMYAQMNLVSKDKCQYIVSNQLALLKKDAPQDEIAVFKKDIYEAGKDFVETGIFTEETKARLSKYIHTNRN